MYFVRPIDEALRPDVRVPGRERRIERIAERTMQLDRGVDHFVNHVRKEHFSDSVLLSQIHAILGFGDPRGDRFERDLVVAHAKVLTQYSRSFVHP